MFETGVQLDKNPTKNYDQFKLALQDFIQNVDKNDICINLSFRAKNLNAPWVMQYHEGDRNHDWRRNIMDPGVPNESAKKFLILGTLNRLLIRSALHLLKVCNTKLSAGGEIFVTTFDLDGVMNLLRSTSYDQLWWARFLLHGYQVNEHVPMSTAAIGAASDLDELHLSSWNEKLLRAELARSGFAVTKLIKYSVNSVPILAATARKS